MPVRSHFFHHCFSLPGFHNPISFARMSRLRLESQCFVSDLISVSIQEHKGKPEEQGRKLGFERILRLAALAFPMAEDMERSKNNFRDLC